jgi:sortase B
LLRYRRQGDIRNSFDGSGQTREDYKEKTDRQMMQKQYVGDKVLAKAAGAAKAGNRVLDFIARVLIIIMVLYGGFSLWETYCEYTGAFLSDDLIRYKPDPDHADDDNPGLKELMGINRDVRAWITIDRTHIDYPVLQGKDDMEYVNKDVYGEFSLSGAIFVSAQNKEDFSDPYNLLYGHHMDNGGMFGDVMEFTDEGYFNRHRTGKLSLPDKTYDLEIYAVVECNAYDKYFYEVNSCISNMRGFQAYVKEKATHYRDINVTADDQIISLSTCVDAQTNGRAVVLGRMVSTEQAG